MNKKICVTDRKGECPCTPLDKKMSGGKYRVKKLFTKIEIFSAAAHPSQQISGYIPAIEVS